LVTHLSHGEVLFDCGDADCELEALVEIGSHVILDDGEVGRVVIKNLRVIGERRFHVRDVVFGRHLAFDFGDGEMAGLPPPMRRGPRRAGITRWRDHRGSRFYHSSPAADGHPRRRFEDGPGRGLSGVGVHEVRDCRCRRVA
jgi:hypothetical protein